MPPKEHPLLSASQIYKWKNCTPSARLEETLPDIKSEAAEEGTAAHALCEHKLKKMLKMRTRKPASKYLTEEMEQCSDEYVSFVMELFAEAQEQDKDAQIFIEQKVDFSKYVPEGGGTADIIIVGNKLLHIVDFKYGRGVLVEATKNPQMMLYAVGAYESLDYLYDIEEIAMTVFQPRKENVSTYYMNTKDLLDWAEDLKPIAEKAFNGDGDFCPGEHCRFCKAKLKCRARSNAKLMLLDYDFKKAPMLSDENIETILNVIDDLTGWANDIKAYAEAIAINEGKKWEGFKLVEGRSVRKFTDENAVIEAAKVAGYTDIFETKLISLTEFEKLMGKEEFNELLGAFVEKPQGKPTLVPYTDKRQEIEINTNVFTDLEKKKG